MVLLLITTTIVALVLKGPDQHLETYILSFIWGIGTGWKWTVDRLVASSIIPDGQDTELMGFFLFSGQALSWIPPLVYTAINEAGIPQRFGVLSMDAYFLLSMLCYYLAGSYKHAREEVNKPTTYDKTSVQQSTIENSKEIDPEETGEQGGEEVEQVP